MAATCDNGTATGDLTALGRRNPVVGGRASSSSGGCAHRQPELATRPNLDAETNVRQLRAWRRLSCALHTLGTAFCIFGLIAIALFGRELL